MKHKIGAVIVIYNPDEKLFALLKSLHGQFDDIIICNNGFGRTITRQDISIKYPNVEIIDMNGNKGIGYALNRGIERLNELNHCFMITFDQDTEVNPEFVDRMVKTYTEGSQNGIDIGIVSPAYRDRNTGEYSPKFIFNKWGFSRTSKIVEKRILVTMSITSGSLTPLSLYDRVGRYIEDMFIDYVDNEFCLRLHQAGIKVMMDDSIVINHSLGERNVIKVGGLRFSPTNYSLIRKYYISRNRIYCIRRYGLYLPGFVMFEILAFTNDLFRIALFEDSKKTKFENIAKGLKDGLTFKPEVEYRVDHI